MTSPALLLLASAALSLPGIETGSQWSFRGSMIGVKGEAAETRKLFDLTVVVAESNDAGATLLWTLEERGRGGFAWPDRVGRWQVDARGQGKGDSGPALLYDRGDGLSVVPMQSMLFAAEKALAKGDAWSQGKLEHLVAGSEPSAGKDCWRVEVRNQYGPKRVLWIEKDRPLVASLSETVFIGQGVQFDLRFELVDEARLDNSQLEKAIADADLLLKLRDQIGRAPRVERGEWNDAQLKSLRAALPTDFKVPEKSLLTAVYKTALVDLNDQKGRSSAVAALRDRVVGKEPQDLNFEDLAGMPFPASELRGNVTVLHFWEYKDSPLEEPYGQTGYLDFLYRQKKASGLRVYGVAVDDRLSDASTRRAAVTGVKKFQSFMNLSYPLLLDSGNVLKKLGDPRPAGGKLPVFVVLDARGKVLLYQVGFFEVKRDRGLEDLERFISSALAEKPKE